MNAIIYPSAKVEDIKQGELVKRKSDSKYCFVRGVYFRESKRYMLSHWNGYGEPIYIKKGTVLFTDWNTSNED
jgi:Ni,Fe-hydrogenase I large subunit